MELHDFIDLVRRKRKTVYGIIALFLVIAAGIIGVQRFKYSSKSQLLVVQEYNGTVDAYTASKSSEHLSSVLASVVTSNSFFMKVLASNTDINAGYFGTTPKDQMKEWDRTVTAKSVNDSGIIAITVYHPSAAESKKIASAINYVLMTQHSAYDGANEAVKVRLIDQPVTSNFPVRPNIPLIAGLALALGFVSSLMYIYLLPEGSRSATASRNLNSPDILMAHSSYISPDTDLPYVPANVEVRGQRPDEAVNHLLGRQQATVDRYHEHVVPGGYLEENISPEEIVKQGSMRNVLG